MIPEWLFQHGTDLDTGLQGTHSDWQPRREVTAAAVKAEQILAGKASLEGGRLHKGMQELVTIVCPSETCEQWTVLRPECPRRAVRPRRAGSHCREPSRAVT